MITTRRVWFPLRSNIAFFDKGSSTLGIEGRLKQMALLADEIWLEPGVMDVVATESVITPKWYPTDALTRGEIDELRRIAQEGEPITYWFDKPGLALHSMIGKAYVAEFMTLTDDAGITESDWVKWLVPDLSAEAEADRQANEHFDFTLSNSSHWLTDNPLLDEHMWRDLNRDLALASYYGVPAAVDHLHEPFLQLKAAAHEDVSHGSAPGSDALRLWVTNFSDLSWEKIVKLRDHVAMAAFREKLIEAEEAVADVAREERDVVLTQLGMNAMIEKLAELHPSYAKLGLDLATGLAFDVFPGGGTLYSGTTGVAKIQKAQTEWTAVLLALKS